MNQMGLTCGSRSSWVRREHNSVPARRLREHQMRSMSNWVRTHRSWLSNLAWLIAVLGASLTILIFVFKPQFHFARTERLERALHATTGELIFSPSMPRK